MSGKVAELKSILSGDTLAEAIAFLWNQWNTQRRPWVQECLELRNFIFATDTTTTSNSLLPWKNSTTLPKLTQIRDNLHANYMAAAFPNDDWLKWEGYSLEDEKIEKKQAISAYMENKLRESGFIETMSRCLLDYIDYGNAFADVVWINEQREDPETGELISGYVGPKAVRISPLDMLINPTSPSFRESPKITRTIKTIGEIKAEAETQPESAFLLEAVKQSEKIREAASSYKVEDFEKAAGYSIDGFGNLYEYYQSPYVEVLEFEGDIHDPNTGKLLTDRVVTVLDRNIVARNEPIPSWLSKDTKAHAGWRLRPDNLYAMGPLANLVGMQYRIDHLENLKADVFDFIAYPPLKIYGEVEEFDWQPGEEIHIDENGDVQMLNPDVTALNADTQIAIIEQKMEEFAGAPREAMGIRSPGEKTAFEIQALQNAASRIFQEKITYFEKNFLEPLINSMLESARRNMNTSDIVRVLDDDIGAVRFLEITQEDITAKGHIRPMGARHFAARAQMMQNLQGVYNSQLGEIIAPHVSARNLSKIVEDLLGLGKFQLIADNIAVFEQMETQRLISQAQEDMELEESLAAEPIQ